MFSLKSASMASFLSSSFSLFLLCQPSYNMNMSSDTSKLLFTEAVALCKFQQWWSVSCIGHLFACFNFGPCFQPCSWLPIWSSLSLSVCVHICLSTHSVCLSICRSSEKMITILGSEWVWEPLCAPIHPDTVGFQHWHSRDCMNAEVLGGAGTTNCSSAHACFSVCAVQKQTDMWNKRNACNGEEEGQEPIRFRFLFFCTDKLKKDHLLWLIIPAYSCLIYSTLLCLSGYS